MEVIAVRERALENGFAERGEVTDSCIMYHVTREGMDFIESITGIKITEDD